MRLVELFVGGFCSLARLLNNSNEQKRVCDVLSALSEISLYNSLDSKSFLVNVLNSEEIRAVRFCSPGSATFSLEGGGRVLLLHSNQMVLEQFLAMEKLGSVRYYFSEIDDFILVTAYLERWCYSFRSPGGLFLEY